MTQKYEIQWQKKEYLFISLLLAVIFAISSLPYIYGQMIQEDNECFMGIVGRGTVGSWGYLMFARQAQQGDFWVENRMTPEVLPYPYFNLEWYSFGAFSRYLHISLLATYHIWRFLSIALFIFGLYYLCSCCLESPVVRMLATSVVLFSSGLGWIIWMLNEFFSADLLEPIDIEGVSIPLYMVFKPHFIRAAAMAVFTISFFIRGEKTSQYRYYIMAGFAAFLHTVMRPYPLPEIFLLCLCIPAINFLKFSKTYLWHYCIILIFLIPSVLYYAYLRYFCVLGFGWWQAVHHMFIQDVFWIGWPLFIGCCLILTLGVFKIIMGETSVMILSLWLLSALFINQIYPYFDGGHENCLNAFSIAPPIFLLYWVEKYRKDFVRNIFFKQSFGAMMIGAGIVTIVLASLLPSTVLAYSRIFKNLHSESSSYYLDNDVYMGLEWLSENSRDGSVVLALPVTSQFIPVVSGNKVVATHFMLTSNWSNKAKQVYDFFDRNTKNSSRKTLLQEYNISYVLIGPEERMLLGDWGDRTEWLECVFKKDNVSIYRFHRNKSCNILLDDKDE